MMKRTRNNRDLADTSDLTDLYPLVPVKKEFECPLCSGLFREAVIITCCGITFCDECIRQELLDKDFVCPKCGAKDQALDSLIPNLGVRQSVNHYVSEWLRANPTRDTSSNGTEGNGKSLNKRPLESSAANEPQAQRQKQQ
jgi:protein MPE1